MSTWCANIGQLFLKGGCGQCLCKMAAKWHVLPRSRSGLALG